MRTAISDVVLERAQTHPGDVALRHNDDALTYADLAAQVELVAGSLAGMGLERSDRVAVYLDKRVETVVALFAVAAAGGAFVPINPALKAPQVAHILRDSGAKLLITSRARAATLEPVISALEGSFTTVIVDGVDEQTAARIGWSALQSPSGVDLPRVIDADLAAILYTSGSTGAPKGVALTHRNLIAGAESVNAYLNNSADDVILSVLPLSFDAGLSQLTTGFAAGAEVVLLNYLLPRDVVRACARYRVTAMTCVPPLWNQLAGQDWGDAASSLRYFANTGGKLSRVTLDRLRSQFVNAQPFLMYGLTEAFRSTYLDPSEVDSRPDSIGKAIPNAEVILVGADGRRCAPGEVGELVHRGPHVALGYWDDPERTAARFRPAPGPARGWGAPELAVWSGDMARMDEDGFLYFIGRNDEMIKTSGYRVSPTEVEDAALAVGEVDEAVALGVADDDLGQRILLVVASDSDASVERLLVALRKSLPNFMVPSSVVRIADIPRTPNGKYDRSLLRAEYGKAGR